MISCMLNGFMYDIYISQWARMGGGQAIIDLLLLILEFKKLFLGVLWPKKTIKTTFKVLGCKEIEKIENF